MKASIIEKVRKNQPPQSDLPVMPTFKNNTNKLEQLLNCLESIAVKVIIPSTQEEVRSIIQVNYPEAKRIVNTTTTAIESIDLKGIKQPSDLDPLDLAIINGSFAVVENGAIWIENDSLSLRAVPFLAEHLVILLPREEIVYNMHEAYQRLEKDIASYGVFIAGPSKTADIEQSLVIGAQGPRSLLVIMI